MVSARTLVTIEREAPAVGARFVGQPDSLTDSEADLVHRAKDAFRRAALSATPLTAAIPDGFGLVVTGPDPIPVGADGAGADELLDWLVEESVFASCTLAAMRAGESDVMPEARPHSQVASSAVASSSGDLLLESLADVEDPVGVFSWPDERVSWANAAMSRRAVHGDEHWTLMDLLDEWSQAHFLVRVLPLLLRGERWRGLLRFVEPDGGVAWTAATVIAHRAASSQIDSIVVFAHEVVPTPVRVRSGRPLS